MHHTVLKAALEVASVGPLEAAFPAHLIVGPTACVLRAIGPEVYTCALFNAIFEDTMVVATVRPDFNAFPILLVLGGHLRC